MPFSCLFKADLRQAGPPGLPLLAHTAHWFWLPQPPPGRGLPSRNPLTLVLGSGLGLGRGLEKASPPDTLTLPLGPNLDGAGQTVPFDLSGTPARAVWGTIGQFGILLPPTQCEWGVSSVL